MATFPLLYSVTVREAGVATTDRFGNERLGLGEPRVVAVCGWAVNATDDDHEDSVLRTIDQLSLFTPERFAADSVVTLPDSTQWRVVGSPEDYRHGPWWDPGLFVVRATRVEG